jgi:hypothetical protein
MKRHARIVQPTPPTRRSRRNLTKVTARVSVAVLAAALVAPLAGTADAAGGQPRTKEFWKSSSAKPADSFKGHKAGVRPERFHAFTLDGKGMKGQLAKAPRERTRAAALPQEVQVPRPDGSLATFAVVESPVMEAGLAAKHPEIKTYAGHNVDNPSETIRLDSSPLGFHASVRGGGTGSWYVDPAYVGDDSLYLSYNRGDLANRHGPLIPVDDDDDDDALDEALRIAEEPDDSIVLRTYRLALVSDPTYANYFGADNVTAAKVTLMNRVNHIYETETAIRMVLIEDNDKLNFNTVASMTGENGPCGSAACYTASQVAGCGSSTLSRNRIVIGQIIGARKYDIGHIIFGLSGGGIASLGVVGGNNKAQGCTGLPAPVGDYFAVDYVAHEIGHQFAGNHTFNGNQKNCSGGNRSAANSVEPGSGSSIMAYAGICDQDNLQPHTDPYWSQRSYQEITTYVSSTRAAINGVQTISLRDFDDTDSFRLTYNGKASAPIVRGTNYTTAGIKAAIEGIEDWPDGGTVTVAAFGGSGSLNDTGFQVTFGGTLAGKVVDLLGLSDFNGASGFVGETAKGGPIDNGGYLVTPTGNHAPVVTTPASFTIPYRTPFALTGSAVDPDGDELTYLWEQNDRGASAVALTNNNKTTGPLFRVFGRSAQVSPEDTKLSPSPGQNHPDGNPTRVFPAMEKILADNTNAKTGTCPAAPLPATTPLPLDILDCYSEFLPTEVYAGPMNFRLTARDGRVGGGGIGWSDTTVNLAKGTGPFRVTGVGDAEVVEGASRQTITWDVAGTDAAPIGVSNVKITMSIDGGKTWPYTVAESTPNNGSATFQVPNVQTDNARFKIEAIGNIFFDVSHTDLAIHGNPEIIITADVLPGALAMEVSSSQVTMPSVTLNGSDQLVEGALNAVTVKDGRGTAAGWNLTGQVSDFVGPNGVIVADNLGWTPSASVIEGTLPTAPGTEHVVNAGAAATPGLGTGLAESRSLCNSPVGGSAGAAQCGGGLTLGVPGSARIGTYTGVLTLTLV